MTLIPLRIYFKRGLAKIELSLAKGKKLHDKRQEIAARDAQREMRRVENFITANDNYVVAA